MWTDKSVFSNRRMSSRPLKKRLTRQLTRSALPTSPKPEGDAPEEEEEEPWPMGDPGEGFKALLKVMDFEDLLTRPEKLLIGVQSSVTVSNIDGISLRPPHTPKLGALLPSPNQSLRRLISFTPNGGASFKEEAKPPSRDRQRLRDILRRRKTHAHVVAKNQELMKKAELRELHVVSIEQASVDF